MNRQPLYDHVTDALFFGSLPDFQKEPLDKLWDDGLNRNRSIYDIAYVMATAYHETARFKYMEEIGRGEGRDYGADLILIRGSYARYHGRGFVQLTWLRNYALMSTFLTTYTGKEVDLVNQPDRAMDPEVAAMVIWEGMIRGFFTGKNLADYTSNGVLDYVDARRIVNGTDKDEMIAGYAREFEHAIRLCNDEGAAPSDCPLSNPNCPKHGVPTA